MKKVIKCVLSVVLAVCIVMQFGFTMPVLAAEEEEFANADLFFEELVTVLNSDPEELLAEEEELANPDALTKAEINEILELYEGEYWYIIYQYLCMQHYTGAQFEDETLTLLADDYFVGMESILYGEEDELSTRSSELRIASGIILYMNSLYEMNKKYELGINEDYIDGINGTLDEAWSLLGTGPETEEKKEEKTEEPAKKVETSEEETDIAVYTIPDTVTLAEDAFYESYGYGNYYVLLTNEADYDQDFEINVRALDEDGEMVAYKSANISPIGPGDTYPLKISLSKDETAASFETTVKASKSKYYTSAEDDLEYELTKIKKGGVIEVTNTGDTAISFPQGTLLFYKDGELVYGNYTYFTDDDSELKPGDTIAKEITSYDEFDELEFYLMGKRD